jgi:16S rRNA processing protein RimM
MGVGDDWVVLGKISGIHGLGGWIKVFSYTQPPGGILDYDPWCLAGPDDRQRRQVSLQDGRRQGKGILAKLDGCGDRDQARSLIGLDIATRRANLPSIGDGEYYWSDLIGLRVVAADGAPLGIVHQMLDTGANDVMVIHGERERLIPFLVGTVVRRVDVSDGLILVDWDPDF